MQVVLAVPQNFAMFNGKQDEVGAVLGRESCCACYILIYKKI